MSVMDSSGSSEGTSVSVDSSRPITLKPGEHDRFIYWYELLKRPGWKNRIIQEREYIGGGRNRYSLSIDINTNELDDRRDMMDSEPGDAPGSEGGSSEDGAHIVQAAQVDEEDCTNFVPFFSLSKRFSVSDFSAKNGQGDSVNLLSSIQVNALIHDALIGCILKYQEMQQLHTARLLNGEEVVDEFYRDLFPIMPITLPSPRMMQVLVAYVESDVCYANADGLFAGIEKTLNDDRLALSEAELHAWWSIRRIYEFRQLLFRFTNERLFVLRVNPCKSRKNTILTAKFTTALNVEEGFDLKGAKRVVAKACLSALFAFAMQRGILPDECCIEMRLSVAAVSFALFYAFLAGDYLIGATRFFGVKTQIPLDIIGMAEEEHAVFKAPPGTVFSPFDAGRRPLLKRNRFKRSRVAIVDCFPSESHDLGDMLPTDEAHAEARYALATDAVALQSHKSWNECDPWLALGDRHKSSNESMSGRRYRKLPYCKSENHDYRLCLKMRPKNGKRRLGYMLTPLIVMASLMLLDQYETNPSGFSALASLIPMIAIALTVSEDETYSKKVFMGVPKASWKLSIAIAAIAIVLRLVLPCSISSALPWEKYFMMCMILLGGLFAVNFVWYCYHLVKDAWSSKAGAFDYYSADFYQG